MDADDTPDRPAAPASIAQVIAEAWHANFSLSLDRAEAAYLAGIHAWLQGDAREPGMDDDTLRRIFAPVHELAELGLDSETQRATLMIARLTNQGILVRTDDGGVVREGEYTLSPLGWALGHAMEKERVLTKRNLSFLLMNMRAALLDVRSASGKAYTEQDWESQVIWPLRDVVAELIGLVDRRQRGLDLAHKALRKEITGLIDREWTEAIDQCMRMVREVDGTLQELNEVLSEHVEHLDRQLYELGQYGSRHPDLGLLLDRTHNQLTRLERWGTRRHEEWHGYYCDVQAYIRDYVQTDPDNLLRSRLTEQIRRFLDRSYGLVIVAPEPFLHLRDVARPVADIALTVPDEILSAPAITEYAESAPDRIDEAVAALVRRIHEDEAIDIVVAVLEVAPDFIEAEYFQLLMRATPALLARGITSEQVYEQAWIPLSERLHAQSLELRLRKQESATDVDAVDLPFTPSLRPHDGGPASDDDIPPDEGLQP